MWIIFSLVFSLLAAFPMFIIISSFVERERTGQGFGLVGAIVLSLIIELLIVLALQAIVVASALLLHAHHPSMRFTKKILPGIVCYFLVIGGFASYITIRNAGMEKRFCERESAGGLYSQIHFLAPITKQEVISIVQTHNLVVRDMTMARKDKLDQVWNQDFRPPPFEGHTGINSTTVILPLRSQIPLPFLSVTPKEISVNDAKLIDAYDRNEPVVWSIEFAPAPMKKMVDLVYELDVRQKRLGIYEETLGVYTDSLSAGREPKYIKPARPDRPVTQSSCYPENIR